MEIEYSAQDFSFNKLEQINEFIGAIRKEAITYLSFNEADDTFQEYNNIFIEVLKRHAHLLEGKYVVYLHEDNTPKSMVKLMKVNHIGKNIIFRNLFGGTVTINGFPALDIRFCDTELEALRIFTYGINHYKYTWS